MPVIHAPKAEVTHDAHETNDYSAEMLEVMKTKGTEGLNEWMEHRVQEDSLADKKRVFWNGFAWGLGLALVIVFFWKIK
jgi:hypothetical protein